MRRRGGPGSRHARYADRGVSLTDVSPVTLAERVDTAAIATFDERRLRVMRPLTGEQAFTPLPLETS